MSTSQVELLKKQINDLSYDIYVDAYPISIGELHSLYKEGDINLKAEYQRVFKWSPEQKTKFIESLLLELPIPPIFLYQDENALWEVVDGIQRLSTIFEFLGCLQDEQGNTTSELILTSAPKLTYLENLKYNDFSIDLKRTFKKSKLDLIIISKKSKKDIKLEVFRRLNGFGTKLNRQELRNALALLLKPDLFKFIEAMSNTSSFLNCLPLKSPEIDNKKHYEYFIRFLTVVEKSTLFDFIQTNRSSGLLDDLFDKTIENIATNINFNTYKLQINFIKTFELLDSTIGEDVFKKYDHSTHKHKGRISESLFEMITPGVYKYHDYYSNNPDELIKKIQDIPLKDGIYSKTMSTNPRAIDRMKQLVNISEEYFAPNE
ncbi:DUF262 domain-containing protein [Clostridium culturomicium]|uniref:DUF262 domain-containing protein n=1 Tax=Clostridium culturomicium TaxID=1499683 RepID=UPI0038575EC5